MAGTELNEQPTEPEVAGTEDAANGEAAAPLSKSAKKRAKLKAKKAAENGAEAEAPEGSESAAGHPAAAGASVDDKEAESGDEDDDAEEGEAAGWYSIHVQKFHAR